MARLTTVALAFFALPASCVAAGTAITLNYDNTGPETVRVTVEDKERQVTGTSDSLSSKYIVFTDSEVFENSDHMLRGKFNSSDLQGYLKAGCTYDVQALGWRNNFLSVYRNILSAEHVPTKACPTVTKPASIQRQAMRK